MEYPDMFSTTVSSPLSLMTRTNSPGFVFDNMNLSTNSPIANAELCSDQNIISEDVIVNFTRGSTIFLLICTLLSSVLQVFVISTALDLIKKRSGDKCLHIFLLSMTIADLILSGIVYPVEFIVHAFDLTVNRQLMMIMHGLSWIGIIISSISLVFMNLDKLYFFKFPLRYSQYFTQRRVTTITIISWILSALFVIVAWITKSFRCIDEHCSTLAIFENKIHVYLSFMVIVGIMPTATSLLVGFYIFKVVKTHSKQIAQEAALFQKDDYSKNSKCDNKGSSLVANRLRTFYFIFISSLFTAITLLPYRMVGIERAINPNAERSCSTILIFWILFFMIYLNSIVNPIITLSVLPQYRKRFIRSICFWNVDNANGSDKSLIRTSIGDI